MRCLSEKLKCNALRAFQAFIYERPLQKHVNNHTDNVNGVTFVTRKHMSPAGPIFLFLQGGKSKKLTLTTHALAAI